MRVIVYVPWGTVEVVLMKSLVEPVLPAESGTLVGVSESAGALALGVTASAKNAGPVKPKLFSVTVDVA